MPQDREAQLAEIERLLFAKGLTVADLREALLQLPVLDGGDEDAAVDARVRERDADGDEVLG